MARAEAACRGGARANMLTREVHLDARLVSLAGLFARGITLWGVIEALMTPEKAAICYATRLVRSWVIRAPASFSSGKCCLPWRARRTPRVWQKKTGSYA